MELISFRFFFFFVPLWSTYSTVLLVWSPVDFWMHEAYRTKRSGIVFIKFMYTYIFFRNGIEYFTKWKLVPSSLFNPLSKDAETKSVFRRFLYSDEDSDNSVALETECYTTWSCIRIIWVSKRCFQAPHAKSFGISNWLSLQYSAITPCKLPIVVFVNNQGRAQTIKMVSIYQYDLKKLGC